MGTVSFVIVVGNQLFGGIFVMLLSAIIGSGIAAIVHLSTKPRNSQREPRGLRSAERRRIF